MSRELFGLELGHTVFEENGDELYSIIGGIAVPDGVAGNQGVALIGSLYVRSGTGELYQKIANAGAPADWELNGSSSASVGVWRSERLSILTNDTQGAGVRDIVASPFSDDEAPLLVIGDFVVGEHIISDADGTPVLLEITAVSAPNVTFALASSALAQDDTFIARNYLPDSPGNQEGQALVNYNGSIMIKIGDVDWDFATGINISAGYASQNGTISSADTVESAIEKLDGNQLDLTTSLGISQGDVDMGTYTGAIISDNVVQTVVNQELETAIEALEQQSGPADIAQNTATVIDTVLVDDCQYAEWEVIAHDKGTPANVKKFKISGFHNGHAAADASSVKDSIFDKQRLGGTFNLQASVVLSGVGAAQTMGLELETNDADGIRYSARRTCVDAL